MRKHILSLLGLITAGHIALGQANIYPAKPQSKPMAVVGATIHTGTGQVIQNGYISFDKGKITGIGDASSVKFNTATTEIINGAGKHIYPGFISPLTNLGLTEIESVRATLDFREVGNMNAHVRSVMAYNTDSKVPNTLRTNGILLAQVAPQGGTISGQSSLMELDGWNWEDAAYKTDVALHLNWPAMQQSGGRFGPRLSPEQQRERYQRSVDEIRGFFTEAKAYYEAPKTEVFNARFAAVKRVFTGEEKVFVSANSAKDIIAAVTFFKGLDITPVLVGGRDAHLVTGLLKDNNISVIINEPHSLPGRTDDDVYLPYKQAKLLQDAGINYALSIDGYWQQRNLPFMAGTAAAHGLTKEQALSAITLNPAKILGVDKTAGSLETGKDATFFVSSGDALDMRTNDVEQAFIRGKNLDLDNLHKQLYKRYSQKYDLK
ncbi:MAG TPA: amidohydrolase family protein [Sphingobacteriaceae bacterium]